MSDFRRLSDTMLASPQITAADIPAAKEAGVKLIVNNRPDDESEGQPAGAEIEVAAKAAGIAYLAIPIGHAGFSLPQVDALSEALEATDGTVLGYCRSGTRSTLLWAMAQAKLGMAPAEIASAAQAAGYSTAPVQATIDMLAGQASE